MPQGQRLGQGRGREKCLPERKPKVYSQDQAVMTSNDSAPVNTHRSRKQELTKRKEWDVYPALPEKGGTKERKVSRKRGSIRSLGYLVQSSVFNLHT